MYWEIVSELKLVNTGGENYTNYFKIIVNEPKSESKIEVKFRIQGIM